MRSGDLAPFGRGGGAVEVDETFLGIDPLNPPKDGAKAVPGNMNKVLSLIDRDSGAARSYVIKDLRVTTIAPILEANISREARLMTDDARPVRLHRLELRGPRPHQSHRWRVRFPPRPDHPH